MQYSKVQYSTIQYNTVQYSTVQYSTVQYSTVQYSTVQYSTNASDWSRLLAGSVSQVVSSGQAQGQYSALLSTIHTSLSTLKLSQRSAGWGRKSGVIASSLGKF